MASEYWRDGLAPGAELSYGSFDDLVTHSIGEDEWENFRGSFQLCGN